MSSAMDGSSTTCSVRALVNDTIWISLVSGLRHDAAHVVLRVLGQDVGHTGGEVDPQQPAGVGVDRRQQEEALPVGGESDGGGAERVVGVDVEEHLPLFRAGAGASPDQVHAPVGPGLEAGPHPHLGVGDEPDDARVLEDHLQLTGLGVEVVDVVELGVVLVEADEELGGVLLLFGDELRLHPFEGGEVTGRARLQLDVVETPVLVAAHVLDVEDPGVVLPPEEGPDARGRCRWSRP